ncbi:MAG: rRNA maturation RNase YbeY [Deltaproteobacteria bacterium]|nr:rRNA maturation RNase YbeY [Deltaproteobacteria bacterium]
MALDLAIDAGVALPAKLRAQVRREVARMVKAAALAEGRRDLDVALRITDDATIHVLNRDWRGKDKPTDVLAFAQREAAAADAGLLGDIVISLDTAKRQARRGLYAELVHLASHGLCHLLGYDHRDDEEERVMNARAAALRREARRSGRVRAA